MQRPTLCTHLQFDIIPKVINSNIRQFVVVLINNILIDAAPLDGTDKMEFVRDAEAELSRISAMEPLNHFLMLEYARD